MIATLPTNPQTLKSGSSEGHHGNPALFSNTTSNFNFAHLGEVGRDRNTGDSAAVCLGGYQSSKPVRLLYKGYPVGYLIAWRNPTVRLKDGTSAAGKRILIDGQQRYGAYGSFARAGSSDERLRNNTDQNCFPSPGRKVRGVQPGHSKGRDLDYRQN